MKYAKFAKAVVSATLTLCLALPHGTTFFNVSAAKTEADTKALAPIIVDMSSHTAMSSSNAEILSHSALECKYAIDSEKGALRLDYSEVISPMGQNRVMFKFFRNDVITSEHKYMRVTYMTEDSVMGKLTFYNNADFSKSNVTVVPDTSKSKGNWVRSEAVYIDKGDILGRLSRGIHCTFGYVGANSPDTAFYIKEIGFFTDVEQAYDYYNEDADVQTSSYTALTYGSGGNGTFLAGSGYGAYTQNEKLGTLDISYAEKTNNQAYHYMCKIKFKTPDITVDDKYVRVLYSAEMPTRQDGKMALYNDRTNATVTFVERLNDTGGRYVLSDIAVFDDDTINRLATNIHCSLVTNSSAEDNVFRIKAVYFFPTLEDAKSFKYESGMAAVDVNGNDIGKYRVVVADDAPAAVKKAAESVSGHIYNLTGKEIPIVTDKTEETEFEILVGRSNRAVTETVYDLSEAGGREESYRLGKFVMGIVGNKVVVTSRYAADIGNAAAAMLDRYLHRSSAMPVEKISLTASLDVGISEVLVPYTVWDKVENVADPTVFTEDFSVDNGYFTEESGADSWTYGNGVYSADKNGKTLSYLHVYERNVTFESKWKYKDAAIDAEAGLMLRYTAPDAWVKAGYDFKAGQWYIDCREGADFYTERVASCSASITPDTWYDISFTADADNATLTVNGEKILTAEVPHITPGRVAYYAENVSVSVDDARITLLSEEGTIIKDLEHTLLPVDSYLEGGTVIELRDGTLQYASGYGSYFKSTDNGTTWQKSDTWQGWDLSTWVNLIRLENGELLRVVKANGNRNMRAQTSKDDGKTWSDGGIICEIPYIDPFQPDNPNVPSAVNMNDKITQMSDGRIFYVQNYGSERVVHNGTEYGRKVFCRFFYSDDNGKTWTKSETDSWEIEGNEAAYLFGEAKIMECADGTLRVYSSWHNYGCIVYSESKDNGVTWGPLVKMPEFVCACSSMQFVRDPYAENDTTYYMVWVNSKPEDVVANIIPMTRARLTLAKTTDGKNFTVLGDLWRWESAYKMGQKGAPMNHIVDPFVYVTEERVFVGAGASEKLPILGDHEYHGAQRQHIWSIKKSSIQPVEKLYNFTDVTTKDASYEAFKFCVDNGLFNGTSATTMGPKVNVSRAMFATVLGRLNGADMTKYTTPTFKDVVAGQWYTNFVEWAVANNVITGYPGGSYGINDNITVEQACLILARYNGFKAGKDGKTMADFTDAGTVSSWAADGVKWAVESGVYEGSGTLLSPTAPASRALMAEMMYNYTTIFGK